MKNRQKTPLHEGKAKILYPGPHNGLLIQYFKDDLTAFNNKKTDQLSGKGVLNNRISAKLFEYLQESGVRTHFIKSLNMREQLIHAVEIIPVEVLVRNYAAGTLAKRLGLSVGEKLPRTLIEYCYKNDALGDPLVSAEHVLTFGWANADELDDIVEMALQINAYLSELFIGIGLQLVDFKLEFGRYTDPAGAVHVILADEISPDTCRLWDRQSGESRDKDRFRQDLGNVKAGYEDVARRLGVLHDSNEDA